MQAICVGEILIDFLPGDKPGTYIRKPGGAPANVAVALAKQGISCGFLGMVGQDDFGSFLLNTLRSNGVAPLAEEPTPLATTTMSFVTLDESGNRSFTFARKPGADMFLRPDQVQEKDILQSTLVHAGSCSLSKGDAAQATLRALRLAAQHHKLVSFDLNYRDAMWDGDAQAAANAVYTALSFIDLLKISDEEISLLGGEGALQQLMQQYNVGLVVQTLGAHGAKAYWKGTVFSVNGKAVRCIDTTGAGDAFWGGFLSSLLLGGIKNASQLCPEIIERALERGNIAGSLCVQKKGAMESLPTAAELESALNSSK